MPAPIRIGFLFPGQGAQFVGMGKDLAHHFSVARQIFEKADEILDYSVSQICFEGPDKELTRTIYAQPAIFVTSLAALAVFRERFSESQIGFSAGLSLGEFTALVAAESLSFEDGLRLVQARAKAMEDAAIKNPGTMASVIGLAERDCVDIAAKAGCEVANLNSPDQIVLSGRHDAVDKACRLAEERGAKKTIMLKVGGAFHSSLMFDAARELRRALSHTEIKTPNCTFVPNVSGACVVDPDQIRELLAQQLTSPVRWVDTMAYAAKESVPLYLEIGPGKVLKGLAKKCQPDMKVESYGTLSDITQFEQNFNSSRAN